MNQKAVTNPPYCYTMYLHGFNNYSDRIATDVLYTGNDNTWTLDLGHNPPEHAKNIRIRLWMTADDHDTDLGKYEYDVKINGRPVTPISEVRLEHGVPFAGEFTNWKAIYFPAPKAHKYEIYMYNRSPQAKEGDWIAIQRIDLLIEGADDQT